MFVKEYGTNGMTANNSQVISQDIDEQAQQIYVTVEATENTIGPLMVKYPYLIEDGLVYLDHQLMTGDHIRLDFLFVDSEGTLVIAELKTEDSEDILLGCMEYYNEIVCNIEGYARIFKDKYGVKINPAKKPRMMLLAPSFGVEFIEKCRWLNMDISAFAYKCIKPRYSEFVLPIFSEVKIPPIPHIFDAVIETSNDDSEEDNEDVEEEDEVEEKEEYRYQKDEPVKTRSYDIYFGSAEGIVKDDLDDTADKIEEDKY